MKYLNQYHKESVERKMKKIAESKKTPMNSIDAAAYMKRNFEKANALSECIQDFSNEIPNNTSSLRSGELMKTVLE